MSSPEKIVFENRLFLYGCFAVNCASIQFSTHYFYIVMLKS